MARLVGAATAEQRFFAKVAEGPGDCWSWTAALNHHGYGCHDRVMAHRWSWNLFRGEIPAGLVIDHLCRNRACVNPDHLDPVTPKVNSMRGATANKTACKYGHPLDGVTALGHRRCLTCHRETERARHTRRKEAA